MKGQLEATEKSVAFFVEENMDSRISLHKTEPVPSVLTVVDRCPLVV